ncbi:MAG: tetratricopeptide repeat protein [Leptolyngbyaceae cyanobacterium bins.302]|nr:tetratricopeptide repeat protein [Leptolyngbyaceae cyanobacterium bins.302]
MNLRMFPVHSNQSRRLRRVSASSDVAHVSSDRPQHPLMSSEVQALKEAYQLVNSTSQRNRFEYLSQSDREVLIRQQAMDKVQQGDVTAAIDLYTQLIRYNPHSASNFNNRGLLHFQNGQPQLALLDYQQALLLNPKLGRVYNNRANCYAALGSFDAAIADYETAIDLDPTDIRARLNLGITLRQLGCYHEAIETFETALQCSQFLNIANLISTSADEGHLYAERGRTYHLLGDWNCAVADYNRALEHLPLSGSASSSSHRLRTQVRNWLNQLFSPLKKAK